ncbi:TMV resistance protein N-like isoform X2 [Malania oleifera]|uniref:TMV resistance protein N-like isoform X2 n=1 Tax=Malania oleifera TaxID=397392 RepID=UPI0025ADB21D|nr:TMV resistance protein N-like isoform X2 [Malania oleifera]
MASTGNRRGSSSASSSSSSPSSSSNLRHIYDVFLSFRGEDTRNSFVSHLYAALHRKGIHTYRDDEKLKRGREISPELVKAIEGSRFSIIIFSENYASSTWCLDELAKIMECKNLIGQTVVPIFYNVTPSEVRKQTGNFAEAFAKHEEYFKERKEKVQRWREALIEATNLSGWDSQESCRSESMLIDGVVHFILNELKYLSKSNAKDLFGIDSRIEELISLLCTEVNDVCFVGIWGMGGIGKTTIAEVVYDQISVLFEGRCFLANVREHDLVFLQEKLLSTILMEGNVNIDTSNMGTNVIRDRLHFRKVLIVLDNVDKLEQLEALAGKHDWFGPGSRIIITTRDKQLLIAHNVAKICKAKQLNNLESFEFFCWKAFGQKFPKEEYFEVTKSLISYAKGLPLALKILGSFLCGRGVDEWKSVLNKLKKYPNEEIQKILRISYDALDDRQKNLFLDIACFFKGDDKEYVTKILESCDFCPIDISVLVEKSLITLEENKVLMHDLLQEMGRDLVRQRCLEEPGRRSRLWSHEDVCHVLSEKSGTEEVQAIVLDLYGLKEVNFSAKAFATMPNLRLLRICFMDQPGGFEYLSRKELRFRTKSDAMLNKLELYKDCKLHISGGFEFLSNKLRCLYWCGFPLKSFPAKFHPENIVELNMSYGRIKQLWKGIMVLKNLKFMKLSHSQNLMKTPNFTGVLNLECLILEGCINLVKIHPSIGTLKRLILLNLKDCKSLRYLVSAIDLDSLESLILSGCSKLQTFPEVSSNMPHLWELSLQGTSIKELPPSIKYLSGLVSLDLKECKNLECLPSSICMLRSLETLTLSGCSKLAKLPEDMGSLECLVGLYADRTAINQLPPSIIQLKNLTFISFCGISAKMSKSWRHQLFSMLLPSRDHMFASLELSPLSRLSSLCILDVRDSNLLAVPNDIGCLSSLRQLYLSHNNFISIPSSISQLSELLFLYLDGCERLQALPELPSSIDTLVADGCTSLEKLPNTCTLNYQHAGFSSCSKLLENQCIDDLVGILVTNQLQAPNLPPNFDTVLPGKEIPKWFSHQIMGDSVSIQLPPNWYDDIVGVAMCVVFKSHDGSCPSVLDVAWGPGYVYGYGLTCDYCIGYKNHPEFKSNEEHLWLGYLKLEDIKDSHVYARRDDFTKINVDFCSNLDSGFVIEKCAACLMSKESAEEKDEDLSTSDETQSEASQFSDILADETQSEASQFSDILVERFSFCTTFTVRGGSTTQPLVPPPLWEKVMRKKGGGI